MRWPKAIEVFTMYSHPGEAAMCRRMLFPLLWAGLGLVCLMCTFPTRAAAAPDERRSSSAAVAPRRGVVTQQHGIHQSAGGGADRVRAPPNTQARGRPARPISRSIGSNRAAAGVPGLGGPGASKRNAMPVPKATAATRNSPIGGPRGQSIGRLGGAVVGRTNHSVAIDGTQFRRKF